MSLRPFLRSPAPHTHRTECPLRRYPASTDRQLCAVPGDLEEVPSAGGALEFMFALVVKDEVGAGEEVGDGA